MKKLFSNSCLPAKKISRAWVVVTLCCVYLFVFSSQGLGGQIIRFGWHQGGTLSLNKERAAILAKYLTNRLNMEVLPVQVKDLAALSQGLTENSIDVASIPNYTYPLLLKAVHILATSEYENKKRMYLYLIANKESGIEKVEDLKGKVAALVVERNQLKCYFLAESIKANPEEYLKRVDTYTELRGAVNAVAEGVVDSTCLSSTAWEILTRFDPSLRQKIKIIKRSPAYAMDPIVASRKLHESIWWNIQSVLISMSRDYAAQQILMQMGIQGFGSPVTDLSAYPAILSVPDSVPAIKMEPVNKKKNEEPKEISQKVEKSESVSVIEEVRSGVDDASPGPEKLQEDAVVQDKLPDENSVEFVAEKTTPAVELVQTIEASEILTVKNVMAQPQYQDTRSAFWKGMENELYLRGGLILLLLIIGLTIISMIRRSSKNKTLTVLLLLNNRIAALRSSLDWKGKLQIESCHISEGIEPESISKLLATIGHEAVMKLALILNSDRILVKEFTFPLLTSEEIPAAINWKLQDLNVPYDEERDSVYFAVTKRDRKQKQISLMAMVQPTEANDIEEWTANLEIEADSTLCVQMALLSRFRKCCPKGRDSRVMLAYRLNGEEALVLILEGKSSFVSRRIYATERHETTVGDVTEVWRPFLPELEQTVDFQNRSSGSSLQALYLAGLGVTDTPDPDGELTKRLGVQVEGIDFLTDIDVSTGVREGCPAIEVLAGAALIFHEQAK